MSTGKDVVSVAASPDLGDLEEVDLQRLRQALEDLRMEIRTFRPAQLPPAARFEAPDWPALFDRLRGYFGQLGMGERSLSDDDFGLDLQLLDRLEPMLDFLQTNYWRVRLEGMEKLPLRSPCVFVANRSGLIPYDGLMLAHVLSGFGDAESRVRFLVSDSVANQPFLQPWLARVGAVRACRENAERLLDSGFSVVTFPEGDGGASKSFRDRYTLVRFSRDGAVLAALERDLPLVPVGLVGPEETHPLLAKVSPPQSMTGLPFLPVTPTFPLLGALGALPLPARWVIRFGSACSKSELEAVEEDEVARMRAHAQIRERVQSLVREALQSRGPAWS
ncbi:MAG: 1-acyl-sn-glycerol-3-phosphate acyltransferase [Myxococcota bacterium]|nr:1-acyl-sn-glycerol-3-phosphate acyltransferase [Myxococcota bacterium]